MDVLITGFIGLISSIITGWASWFITRKKYNAEVDQTLVQNMKSSLDFYKQLSDDNRERLQEVLKRNDELEEEIKKLRDQMFSIMSQICLSVQCPARVINRNLNKNSVKSTNESVITNGDYK